MRRPTTTLALPGDADAVLAWEIARAIHRDGRLTARENYAKASGSACAYVRDKFANWPCHSSLDPCTYCDELR